MDEKIKIIVDNDPDILSHYPDYFLETDEINAICDGENPELKLYIERAVKVVNNTLPRTSDYDGVKKYEKWLDIPPDKIAGLSLEQRKDQIVAKLNETLPYTEITLQKMLANIVGWGNFSYRRDGAFVEVTLEPEAADSLQTVYDMLTRVLPMNLHFRLNGEVVDEADSYVYGIGTMLTEDMIQEVDYTEKIEHIYIGGASIHKRIIRTPAHISHDSETAKVKVAVAGRQTLVSVTQINHNLETAVITIGIASKFRPIIKTPITD